MTISLNINESREFRLDLGQLPVTHSVKGSKFTGIFVMLFSAVWGGIPTWILVANLLQGNIDALALFLLVFMIIGTVLFLTGLHELTRVAITSIDKDRVLFAARSLIRSKQWVEDIDRYEGISYREESHGGTKGSRPYTLYIVELYHTDSNKRLKLYQSACAQGVRSIWEDFCRKLNLPAVEKDGNSLIKRNVEDLDKSIRDLVKEGKIHIDFDPSQPPPSGLKAKAKGDDFQVINARGDLTIIGCVIAVMIPTVLILVGFLIPDNVPMGIVGIILGLVVANLLFWDIFSSSSITIGENTIRVNHILPWGETEGTTLMTSEIESVVVDKKDNHFHKQVFITTDRQQVAVGGGLSAEALEWLKNCILSIISV